MAISDSTEIWRTIPGYEGWFSVSNTGRVRRDKVGDRGYPQAGCILRQRRLKGYCFIDLWRHGTGTHVRVHRLVLLAFVGSPRPDQQTRHLDGCRHNNTLSNLKWGTVAENVADSKRHGTRKWPLTPKLTVSQVKDIRHRYAKGICTQVVMAREFQVTETTIWNVIHRRTWGHVA